MILLSTLRRHLNNSLIDLLDRSGFFSSNTIKTNEIVSWDFKRLFHIKTWANTLLLGLFFGLFFGLQKHSAFALTYQPYQRYSNLLSVILMNLVFLIYSVFIIFMIDFIDSGSITNSWQAINAKLQIDYWQIVLMLFFIVVMLIGGGLLYSPLFQHFYFRLAVYYEGNMPLDWVDFFDKMRGQGILEKDGGAWRFRHQLLQNWFLEKRGGRS